MSAVLLLQSMLISSRNYHHRPMTEATTTNTPAVMSDNVPSATTRAKPSFHRNLEVIDVVKQSLIYIACAVAVIMFLSYNAFIWWFFDYIWTSDRELFEKAVWGVFMLLLVVFEIALLYGLVENWSEKVQKEYDLEMAVREGVQGVIREAVQEGAQGGVKSTNMPVPDRNSRLTRVLSGARTGPGSVSKLATRPNTCDDGLAESDAWVDEKTNESVGKASESTVDDYKCADAGDTEASTLWRRNPDDPVIFEVSQHRRETWSRDRCESTEEMSEATNIRRAPSEQIPFENTIKVDIYSPVIQHEVPVRNSHTPDTLWDSTAGRTIGNERSIAWERRRDESAWEDCELMKTRGARTDELSFKSAVGIEVTYVVL